MIQLASSPLDPAAACSLLDALVAALDRVDRNQRYRAKLVSWDPCRLNGFQRRSVGKPPPPEARLALAWFPAFPLPDRSRFIDSVSIGSMAGTSIRNRRLCAGYGDLENYRLFLPTCFPAGY